MQAGCLRWLPSQTRLHRLNLLRRQLLRGEQARDGGMHNRALPGRPAGEGMPQPLAQLQRAWQRRAGKESGACERMCEGAHAGAELLHILHSLRCQRQAQPPAPALPLH